MQMRCLPLINRERGRTEREYFPFLCVPSSAKSTSPSHPFLIRKGYVPSEQSGTTGASTPLPSAGSVACKVTPLPDAPPDLNARYPYGADAEEWSNYEASESAYAGVAVAANPMLRRNQYWV
ncbi:hypothetical protein RR48_08946 [Papilio machaon]|uniref:Uncharacterized protein n=1 Tax=Papilio machaon TaxID=76193 RepID=A0A194R364_PAPMA|nr:hypothetical protein RR48_08946 [Papilio machaon]